MIALNPTGKLARRKARPLARAARGKRVFNFAAGPAVMPERILLQAREEMLDWKGLGLSVWEMPFTGAAFRKILSAAHEGLRALLGIPPHYKVLFMHGGASAQFSIVPLNLLRGKPNADYVETGHWARKAIREGARYCRVHLAASGAPDDFRRIPGQEEWELDPKAAYCHITTNETGNGVAFHWTPETGEVPLVADATSEFLSRPMEVERYGLVYAGAQKNIGPAGLTVVILREDLIGGAHPYTPSVLDYKVMAESGCMFNTPLTYAVYLAGLVFEWLREQGGLEAMERVNRRKAAKLYAAIDGNDFYRSPVAPADRSRTNLCFALAEPALEGPFLSEAERRGLVNLAGHKAVGGLRASLYNAMPEEGVDALIAFMEDFSRVRG